MKTFKIYPLIIVLFFSLSVFNTAHADCNINDKSVLKGKDLTGCNLQYAYLERADLTGAYLNGANLIRTNLKGAVLTSAFLRDADLRGADFRYADLERVDLTGAKLEGATWVFGRKCASKSIGECL